MPPLPRPQGLIIDLDDTLLDTTDSSTRVWRATRDHFLDEIGRSPEAIDSALDHARDWYWQDPVRNAAGRIDLFHARVEVVQIALDALAVDQPGLAQRFADHYTEHRVAAMQLFPEARETLAKLRGRGLKLVLLSNGHGESQRQKVTRFELAAHFDAVLIEGEMGVGKPDPVVYERAMDAMGIGPGQTWIIGDNLRWEVVVPQELGLTAVWVDFAGRGLPKDSSARPDAIVQSVAELPALLDQAGTL